MAQKPRVKAPKQRGATQPTGVGGRKRWLVVAVAVGGLLVAVAAVAALLGFVGGGGGGSGEAAARSKLEAAGCTL